MPNVNREKMKSALLYLDARSRGPTSRCCRIVHAKNLALSGAIYTLNISIFVVLVYAWRISTNMKKSNELGDVYYASSLLVENGTFSWGEEETVLKNINFKVDKGKLAAVVGTVGSGKSLLLSAVLGEMEKISGRVYTIGKIAYVSQQAWIQNCTLQENILFGKPLDQRRYQQVVAACALKPDIEMLPGGDQTEIEDNKTDIKGNFSLKLTLIQYEVKKRGAVLF